jgi:opacity protein-like surface antigen
MHGETIRHWRHAMKKFVVTAALATLLAVPALATSYAQEADAQSQRNAMVGVEYGYRAQAPGAATNGYYGAYSENDTSDQRLNGTLVGRDPDANVRLQLRNDEPADWSD